MLYTCDIAFCDFWSLAFFFQFYPWIFLFHLIFIFNLILLFIALFLCFILFYFILFCLLPFYCICFLNSILVLILFIATFSFNLAPNYFLSFCFYSIFGPYCLSFKLFYGYKFYFIIFLWLHSYRVISILWPELDYVRPFLGLFIKNWFFFLNSSFDIWLLDPWLHCLFYFFFFELSRSYILGNRLIRVNLGWLNFFFLYFLWGFFFSFLSFSIILLALEFCDFFSFLSIGLS